MRKDRFRLRSRFCIAKVQTAGRQAGRMSCAGQPANERVWRIRDLEAPLPFVTEAV
jgi:hypothetical protein